MRVAFHLVCLLAATALLACGTEEPIHGELVVRGLGVELGPFDPLTGRAGDFQFVDGEEKVFLEFGASVRTPDGGTKELPTFEYRVRPDAPVRAIAAGRVVRLDFQPETDDWEIAAVSVDPRFEVIYDHVREPTMVLGDVLAPGDVLGRPGPWSARLGRFEIMIVDVDADRAHCPCEFFAPELAPALEEGLRRLMIDWEEFRDDPALYDDGTQARAGCRFESMALR